MNRVHFLSSVAIENDDVADRSAGSRATVKRHAQDCYFTQRTERCHVKSWAKKRRAGKPARLYGNCNWVKSLRHVRGRVGAAGLRGRAVGHLDLSTNVSRSRRADKDAASRADRRSSPNAAAEGS